MVAAKIKSKRTSGWQRIALATMLLLAVAATAQACPTCGAGMAEGGEAGKKLINGWFWSIMFMMSMPFAILTTLGGYMYWIVRKARRVQAAAPAAAVSTPAESRPEPQIETLPGTVASIGSTRSTTIVPST